MRIILNADYLSPFVCNIHTHKDSFKSERRRFHLPTVLLDSPYAVSTWHASRVSHEACFQGGLSIYCFLAAIENLCTTSLNSPIYRPPPRYVRPSL